MQQSAAPTIYPARHAKRSATKVVRLGRRGWWVRASTLVVVAAALLFAPSSGSFLVANAASVAPDGATVWSVRTTPRHTADADRRPVHLGTVIKSSESGYITGVRFYKGRGNYGTHTGSLWTATGKRLAVGVFRSETSGGWQQLTFRYPVPIVAGRAYVVSYYAPKGHYAGDQYGLSRPVTRSPLTALKSTYAYSNHTSVFPTRTYKSTNYYVDVTFKPKPKPKPSTSTTTSTTTTSTPTTSTTTTAAPSTSTTSSTTSSTTTASSSTTSTTTAATANSSGGWPSPSTTGVPAGTVLKPSGSLTITTPGAVVSNLDITGTLAIYANNVTVKDTKVTGKIDTSYKYTGIQITDVEVDHSGGNSAISEPAIGLGGYTCTRCYVHGVGHGLQMSQDYSAVIDSYIVVTESNDTSHKDAVISNGSQHLQIKGSVLTCASEGCTAAIGLFGDDSTINDVVIDHNLVNTTGGYCMHGGVGPTSKPYPNGTNIHITNNTFGTKYSSKCGIYGPAAYYGTSGTNSFTGNVWAGTGAAVN